MRRFIECLTTNSSCNLKCSYCYLIQQGRRKNEKATFNYSAEYIAKALSIERLGGVSLISITAAGETLIPQELPSIVREILKQGHFVNITTNGTLYHQINRLIEETEGFHSHLHLSFSFHYVELKKKNLIDTFFENIKKARESGCSILLQINLVDEYIPYWDEIKELSLKYVGALPQVALTRLENNHTYKIFSNLSFEKYKKVGDEMKSPLFDFTCKHFMVKRKEYCYAGWWTATLNMGTGVMTGCYGQGFQFNIFDDVKTPIPFEPIGRNCCKQYCFNSSHFISQGVIPSLMPIDSYGKLRNREEACWYSDEMKKFLYSQLQDVNSPVSLLEKVKFRIVRFRRNWPTNLKFFVRCHFGLNFNL